MTVFGISGEAQAGKTTSANCIAGILRNKGHSVLIIHNADLLKFMCKVLFGWDGNKDEKGRTILQYVGTDIVRKKEPDFWVNFIIKILDLFENNWDYVLIPDCRFPNELDRLKESGLKTIHLRVVRPGHNNGLTETQKNHPSETALKDYPVDKYIYNTAEDLKEFHDICESVLEEIL